MNSRPKRIAIVRLSALGDIINSAVVVQFVRRHLPDAEIDWIVEEAFAPVLQPHPDLDAVHTVPLKRLKREKSPSLLKKTLDELRSFGPYDLVIDLQGLLKSAVVARLAGKNVHGFDAASAREGLAAKFYRSRSRIPYETNIVRRNCDLVGEALGFRVTDGDILAKAPALAVGERPAFLRDRPRYIAVVVGASWASKRYPADRLAEVCDRLPLPCILVWGNPQEKADAETVAHKSANASVAPPLTLPQLRDLVGHADLTVGGDTGPTHLAWALNRPSVVLFGPTTPRMMFETPRNVAIESDSPVDLGRIDKNDMSIATIPPETIAETARRLL